MHNEHRRPACRNRLAGVALLAATIGCFHFGPTPQEYAPAVSPRGAHVRLGADLYTTLAAGELVAVTDSGLLLDDGTRLAHIARSRFTVVRVRGARVYEFRPSQWARIADHLRPFSRFPQGLTPELERRSMSLRR